jgi:hypothetical protein
MWSKAAGARDQVSSTLRSSQDRVPGHGVARWSRLAHKTGQGKVKGQDQEDVSFLWRSSQGLS